MTRVALALVLLAALPSAGSAKGKLYTFIVVDSDDKGIGKSVEADGRLVQSLLEDGFAGKKDRLALKVLKGKDCSFVGLRDALAGLPKLDDDDSLLVLFSGHGAYVPARGLHVLCMGSDLVSRSSLLAAMRLKGGRLQLLITDACASFPRDTADRGPLDKAPAWETMQGLFFTASGTLDVNACAVGQVAFCDRDGSFFIRALCEALRKPFAELVRADAKALHWQDILPDMQGSVRERYRDMLKGMKDALGRVPADVRPALSDDLEKRKSQGDQTLGVWAVPSGGSGLDPDGNGLVYLPRRGKAGGVEVLAVGLKAAPLTTGDVVFSVDGKKTATLTDFREQSRGKGDFRVKFTRPPVGDEKVATLRGVKD